MKWKNNNVSIKHRLFGYFFLLVSITIAFLWIFEIIFLDDFYKHIQINEAKKSADVISRNIESTTLEQTLTELAYKNGMCIDIINLDTYVKLEVEATRNCIIHKFPFRLLLSFGDAAINNNGKYYEILTPTKDNYKYFFPTASKDSASLIYAQIAQSNGSDILIIINSLISPVNATVNTIKIELILLTFILIILAFILAYEMNKKISKPIMQINESAKELAKGNYGTTFIGNGYKEVNELSDTLNYASRELGKVESLRQELIANISHDLRTPLTMIGGYAEAMRDLPDENNPENAQVIIDEAARLSSLVNDVLDLSKLQAGTQELTISSYNLTKSILLILERFTKFVSRDGYNIQFNYQEEVMVEADEIRITQVIYNLINNALTYTGDDKTVIINQIVDEDTIRIEVIDHGVGISQDQLDTIWERYYKASNQHKRAVNGTGLGLSIVKSILDAHNAIRPNMTKYGVISKENEGSCFYFTLRK